MRTLSCRSCKYGHLDDYDLIMIFKEKSKRATVTAAA
jgi:hypothetical protein